MKRDRRGGWNLEEDGGGWASPCRESGQQWWHWGGQWRRERDGDQTTTAQQSLLVLGWDGLVRPGGPPASALGCTRAPTRPCRAKKKKKLILILLILIIIYKGYL